MALKDAWATMRQLAAYPEPVPIIVMPKLQDDFLVLPQHGEAIQRHTDRNDREEVLCSLQPDDFMGEGLTLQQNGSWRCLTCQPEDGGHVLNPEWMIFQYQVQGLPFRPGALPKSTDEVVTVLMKLEHSFAADIVKYQLSPFTLFGPLYRFL